MRRMLFLLFAVFQMVFVKAYAQGNILKFQSVQGNTVKVPTQRNCFTPEAMQLLNEKYALPGDEEYESRFSELQRSYLKARSAGRIQESVITIPVIVHVIHNGESVGSGPNISAAQVQSQIEVLNEDFRRAAGTNGENDNEVGADVGIEFALAVVNEDGNRLEEPGIDRLNRNRAQWRYSQVESQLKSSTIWNPGKYFNIWTVNFGGDEQSEELLGYAQFPTLSGLDGLSGAGGAASTDGVVVAYWAFGKVGSVMFPYNLGRTTTHEVGHWLGLRHIWGDGDCSDDDYCDDTPNAQDANYSCERNFSCGSWDMIENYMDYTPDACMNIFTEDQKTRMQTVMANSPRRVDLLSSTVHTNEPFEAKVSAARTIACPGEIINLSDTSEGVPTSWQWMIFDTDSVGLDTLSGQDISISFTDPGPYSVLFSIKNDNDSAGLWLPNFITILVDEEVGLPINENFEGETSLENWVLYNPGDDRSWAYTETSSGEGEWSVVMDNYSGGDSPYGTEDGLFTPLINLDAYQNAYLTFDVAYARYSNILFDSLMVLASTDCGNSFEEIWSKPGADLATSEDDTLSFFPESNEWWTERISLNQLNGYSEVHLLILNVSGWGNNLYLDNVSISVPDPVAQPEVAWYVSRDTISINQRAQFYDNSEGYPFSWEWTFEGAEPSTSDEQNPAVYYDSAGVFDVSLKVENTQGEDSVSLENQIVVISSPTVSFQSDRLDEVICVGDSISITADGASYYSWFDNRGTQLFEGKVSTFYPTATNVYTLIGTDRFGGRDTLEIPVTVYNVPSIDLGDDVTITLEESVTLKVGSGAGAYLWSDGSTEESLVIMAAELGLGTFEYSVVVTNGGLCEALDTVLVTVTQVPLATLPDVKMEVYPIPAGDVLYLSYQNVVFETAFIFDVQGKVVKRYVLGQNVDRVDVSELSQGMYLISLSGEQGQVTQRFLKR